MTTSTSPALREPSQRVSPRARLAWGLGNLIGLSFLGAAFFAAVWLWDAISLTWWMLLIAAVVLVADVIGVPQWRYLVHRWEVSETAVYTQTGWWSRERRIAPMSRIQTVDLAEDAISRIFGLATVTVTTASAAGALEIAGLERARALSLVEELTIKADADEGDAT